MKAIKNGAYSAEEQSFADSVSGYFLAGCFSFKMERRGGCRCCKAGDDGFRGTVILEKSNQIRDL